MSFNTINSTKISSSRPLSGIKSIHLHHPYNSIEKIKHPKTDLKPLSLKKSACMSIYQMSFYNYLENMQ